MFSSIRVSKFIGCFVMLLSWNAFATTLSASVDRDSITIDDTLVLVVKTDEQGAKSPDFSALKSDFDILGNSQSRNIQVINGRAESAMEWQLTLAPKRLGRLLIPSFTLDNAVSDAIEINVAEPSTANQTSADTPVKVLIEVDKSEIYTQEQLLVTIKLVTEVNLAQAELQNLEIPNAIIEKLDVQQYQSQANGKPQLVVETRYAIYPQVSGELTIPALVYSVVPQSRQDLWNDPFGRRRAAVMRLRTQEKKIAVAAAVSASEWHPASTFSLNEGWTGDPDEVKVGEPITRTITIMADGLTAGQLQPIKLPSVDGLTFYPDQPQTKDNKSTKGIQGVRTESVAIIPTKPGDISLPAVKIQWWDTKTKTLKTAELPEKTLHVTGVAANSLGAQAEPFNGAQTSEATNAVDGNNRVNQPSTSLLFALAALIVSLIVNLGLVITLFKRRSTTVVGVNKPSAEFVIPKDESAVWDAMKLAEKSGNLKDMKAALLAWGQLKWPDKKIHGLRDLATWMSADDIRQQLYRLDEAIYGDIGALSNSLDLHELLSLLNQERKRLRAKQQTPDELPPLYKS